MKHNWAQISYSTPYQAHLKGKRLFESKIVNLGEIARVHFSNITETARLPGSEFFFSKQVCTLFV